MAEQGIGSLAVCGFLPNTRAASQSAALRLPGRHGAGGGPALSTSKVEMQVDILNPSRYAASVGCWMTHTVTGHETRR